MSVPVEWHTFDEEKRFQAVGESLDKVAGDDVSKKIKYNLSKNAVVPLVMAFGSDPAANTGSSASITMLAEKVTIARTEEDYLELSKPGLQEITEMEGVPVVTTMGDIQKETINDVEFTVLPVTMDLGGGALILNQKLYVKIIDKYVICITSTSKDEAEAGAISGIINTLTIS